MKIKECKVNMLKLMVKLEEKYKVKGYVSPFSYFEKKLTASNIAVWKMVQRGVITPEEVRIAIYQLEQAGLIQIINNTNIKLTDNGREIAYRVRPMTVESVPDTLLGEPPSPSIVSPSNSGKICPNCGKVNAAAANFCDDCGSKLAVPQPKTCPNCGAEVATTSKFCSTCGTPV